MSNKRLVFLLVGLNFIEFAVWGAYLTSLGRYLGSIGLGSQIKWFFAMQGIVSIFTPTIMGLVADRHIQAQKLLALCHALAGLFMIAAGAYCHASATPDFAPLFLLYSFSVAFFMPTLSLANSVSFSALNKNGMDPVQRFPRIRIFGTLGFICSMLATNFVKIEGVAMQDSYMQLFSSGIISLVMTGYALCMPPCETHKAGQRTSVAEAFNFKAFALFKDRQFAVFFIFSMFLGTFLQITNGYANMFLGSFGSDPAYSDTFAVKNSNALISLSQISETFCILLIPVCMKRFGIKKVMLISMGAWVLRFGFFGLGNPAMPGVLFFVLSCLVYGVAFDFFNISGSLFVEQNTSSDIRSSAQGLFMLMTNGLGTALGTLLAGVVMDLFVFKAAQPCWTYAWYLFAGYALVVAIAFMICFKETAKSDA